MWLWWVRITDPSNKSSYIPKLKKTSWIFVHLLFWMNISHRCLSFYYYCCCCYLSPHSAPPYLAIIPCQPAPQFFFLWWPLSAAFLESMHTLWAQLSLFCNNYKVRLFTPDLSIEFVDVPYILWTPGKQSWITTTEKPCNKIIPPLSFSQPWMASPFTQINKKPRSQPKFCFSWDPKSNSG